MSIPALLLLPALVLGARARDGPGRLNVGETIEGVIAEGAPVVETEKLVAAYTDAPTVGLAFELVVDEAGACTLELRSWFFDAYLVLRDAEGAVLAEDDDGLFGTHARLVARDLEPGRTYRVEACALHGKRGPFELACRRGEPPPDTPALRAALELDDAERRVRAVEAVAGESSEALVAPLEALGEIHFRRGDYDRTRPPWERALAICEQVFGPEHAETATSLNDLARLLLVQGDDAGARPLFERALAIREQVLGPEHPFTAVSANNLGALLKSRGDYAAARPLCERTLAIFERVLGSDHPDTAAAVNNLAELLRRQGDYAAARPLHERALAIRERTLGPEHPETAASLGNLALLLESLGDPVAARPLHERALALFEKVLGPDHPDTATARNNLAMLLEGLGDSAAARPLYERVLAIREQVLGPDHPETAKSLNNLALLLERQGDLAGARRLHERALASFERSLGPEHPDTATSLCNLAALLARQGDLAAARPLHERALAIRETVLPPEHPSTATSLNNLAMLLESLGEHAAARALCERALGIRERVLGSEHPGTAQSLTNLALLLVDAGDPREAWSLLQRAWRDRDERIDATLAVMSEGERYAYLATLSGQLELTFSVARSLDDPDVRVEAYDTFLRWKGRVGRLLTASREQLVSRMGAEERALVEDLRRCQAQLSRLASGTEIRDRTVQEERLAGLRDERGRLERELYRSAGSPCLQAPDFQAVRSALGSGAALVDFFAHGPESSGSVASEDRPPPRLTAWITRDDREEPIELDLGPTGVLEAALKAFLEELVARRGVGVAAPREGADAGAALRALLWEPLAPWLEGIETVFVSPDGALGTLPFETLPLADGSRAVERFAFVYLQDASALLAPARDGADFSSLLSVGGVDFRRREAWKAVEAASGPVLADAGLRGSFGDYWGRLPATEYESQVVHDLHEDAFGEQGRRLLLQGGAPSEERLKHELGRHAVLHLATHGYFQPEGMPSMWEEARDAAGRTELRLSDEAAHLVGKLPGLLSGLVCAGANRGGDESGDDGYLTAEEVGWLDLSGVELVVLSACETGLGRPQSGEGLLGLRRAFETAGARTVISSLWSVKDESTSELMRDFYENLWRKGMGRHEALRAAQLAMLRRNRLERGADLPSTWGAFVLSGEWR